MKGRSFRSPRCPACRRPMLLLGGPSNDRRYTYFCKHGIREVRYPKPRGSVVGRVTRGVEFFAQVVGGKVVQRTAWDYGKKEELGPWFYHGWSFVDGELTPPREA